MSCLARQGPPLHRGAAGHTPAGGSHRDTGGDHREGLARPKGRYVTLDVPSVSVLDEQDSRVIELACGLRALLPEGRCWCWGGQPPCLPLMPFGPPPYKRCW